MSKTKSAQESRNEKAANPEETEPNATDGKKPARAKAAGKKKVPKKVSALDAAARARGVGLGDDHQRDDCGDGREGGTG